MSESWGGRLAPGSLGPFAGAAPPHPASLLTSSYTGLLESGETLQQDQGNPQETRQARGVSSRGTPDLGSGPGQELVVSCPAELLTSAWDPAKSEAGTVAGEPGDPGLGFLLSRASQPKCRNRVCLEGRPPADKHSSCNGQRGLLAAEGVGERSL